MRPGEVGAPVAVEVVVDKREFYDASDDYMDRQLRPALERGVNRTAARAVDELQRQARLRFRNPNDFTLDAFDYIRSERGVEDPASLVFVKERQARYLQFQIYGGVRSERPSGKPGVVVPGASAPKDSNGEVPQDYVTQAERQGARWIQRTEFLGPILVDTRGGGYRVIALIADRASYDVRFPFFDIVKEVVERRVVDEVEKSLAQADANRSQA